MCEPDSYGTKYLHRLLSEGDLEPHGKCAVLFILPLFHGCIECADI